jgi:hypothetical protein
MPTRAAFRAAEPPRCLSDWSRSGRIIIDSMQRQPMPRFWIAMQVVIVICVLISAVIVIVKL